MDCDIKEKRAIMHSVVNEVTKLSPPGRFMEKCSEIGLWREVANERALEKAAQALRDGAAQLRMKIEGESMQGKVRTTWVSFQTMVDALIHSHRVSIT